MSEFNTLKNMLDRNGAKYEIDIEKDYDEETETEYKVTYLCIPALSEEFLILGFDEDEDLIYIDAGSDWERYLKRRKAMKGE